MSKNINLNDNNWIDIVFENRNHEYGAYQIRKNYNRNSILGIVGMFSFLGLAFGGIVLFSSFKSAVMPDPVVPQLYDTVYIIMPELPPLEEEKVEPSSPTVQEDIAQTIKNTIPDIVPDLKVPPELLPPTNEELIGKEFGINTNTEGTGTSTLPSENVGSGTGTIEPPTYLGAQKMPEFPGGEDALLAYVKSRSHFTKMAREYNVSGTIYVTFVVDENGKVINPKIERGIGYGMDEMLVSVINNLPDFTPAMQDGRNVRVKMMLPVKFEMK